MTILFAAFLTFIATALGGFIALKNRHNIHLIMGFTSGIILGVVSLEILPEITRMVKAGVIDENTPMVAMVIGFLLFHVLEKVVLIHNTQEEFYAEHTHPNVGIFSSILLIAHSFLDGAAIGIGFKTDPAIGILLTFAVVGHNFADGLNTVTLMVTHNNPLKKTLLFLLMDSIAPVFGITSAFLFSVPDYFMAIFLGFFSGSLLYIGASEILPEAHKKKKSYLTIGLTVMGTGFIYLLTRVI